MITRMVTNYCKNCVKLTDEIEAAREEIEDWKKRYLNCPGDIINLQFENEQLKAENAWLKERVTELERDE